MSETTFERPVTLSNAFERLSTPGAHALSGGTDLAVAIRHGKVDPSVVVDVKSIPELAPRIESRDDVVEIGANTVMTDLEHHDEINALFPGLVEAARVVGSVQIRNRATLAGNLANASPAADTPPVLLALDAKIAVDGPDGIRLLNIDDFFLGYRRTALETGELISAIHLPKPKGRAASSFLKLGVRRAMEISVVCVGAAIALDDSGVIVSAGIGLGSVAPTTLRAGHAEELLLGEQPSSELFAAAGAAAGDQATPIDDLRASGEYRKAMVPVLVRRTLEKALQRADR